MTCPTIGSTTRNSAIVQHGPAGIHGNCKREWECGSDGRADVRDEAQHCGQDAPQDRTWDADNPQADPDNESEGTVQKKLGQEKPAEAARGVIQCGGSAL